MSDPFEGREEEYNQWYQDVHLPELVKLEGIKSARRCRRARTLGDRETYAYMVTYDIETDDIDAVVANLTGTARRGDLNMSDAIDRENSHAAIYEQIGPEVFEL